MKTKPFSFIAASCAAVLISPVFAIDAPEDDAPPPPTLGNKGKVLPEIKLPAAPKPATKSSAAFLGVVSGEVPEMLIDHLNLKHGEGIVVRSLVPDGPAAKSGLAVNDVITRVAGQPVGSPLDVSKQIANHKPDENVRIDLIHHGKATQLDVKLGNKPAEIATAETQSLNALNLDGLPTDLADRIRASIEGNMRGMSLPLGINPPQLPSQLQGNGNIQLQGGATLRMKDNQGSVEVKSIDGAKQITLRDQQDNVTWSGPWNTDQDKSAAPADARVRIDSLNIDSSFKGNGLRLRMGPAAQPPPLPPLGE